MISFDEKALTFKILQTSEDAGGLGLKRFRTDSLGLVLNRRPVSARRFRTALKKKKSSVLNRPQVSPNPSSGKSKICLSPNSVENGP